MKAKVRLSLFLFVYCSLYLFVTVILCLNLCLYLTLHISVSICLFISLSLFDSISLSLFDSLYHCLCLTLYLCLSLTLLYHCLSLFPLCVVLYLCRLLTSLVSVSRICISLLVSLWESVFVRRYIVAVFDCRALYLSVCPLFQTRLLCLCLFSSLLCSQFFACLPPRQFRRLCLPIQIGKKALFTAWPNLPFFANCSEWQKEKM